jgi:hypothetical protein
MIQPRGVVDPAANLDEEFQVLSPQIHFVIGATEVEAAILGQFRFGVFPAVART